MTNHDPGEVVDMRDRELNSEAIMQEIRTRLRQRRADWEQKGVDFEALATGRLPSTKGRFEPDLYDDVQRLNASYDKIGVGLSLTASRRPIIGPLLERVRGALHQLVIYYVNMLARQQARVNGYLAATLTALVRDLDRPSSSADLDALRNEVVHLRARVEELEAQLKRPQS
jgi:hypothetical protein